MNNLIFNTRFGFVFLALIFSISAGFNTLSGQQLKIAEDQYQYFEDIYLGVRLEGLSTKYQYYIDQNEKLVKNGYYKAQLEYTDRYGSASKTILYKISGNYKNGRKDGKWTYEEFGYKTTYNFSKEVESILTTSVEYKEGNVNGKTTANLKERGQTLFNVECTMKNNFIFGKFLGKGKDFDISGEFDGTGLIHGEWIIQKKGVIFIGDDYDNLRQLDGLTIKKYYVHGVLNEYKVYTTKGELLEKCKNKLTEYLEANQIDSNLLRIDTFYVLNASDVRQSPTCKTTDRPDVIDNDFPYSSKNTPYYLVSRKCSNYSKYSKFELNLYSHNSRGIGFLNEAEKQYNNYTREILLKPVKSTKDFKDLEQFASTFNFYNNKESTCGRINLAELSKTAHGQYFFSRMYDFFQRLSMAKTNFSILKFYENLDQLQNKICESKIYTQNNLLLGSNDIRDFTAIISGKQASFNEEFNKMGGKCWKNLTVLDNIISNISKNLDVYIDIPHASGNNSKNPKFFNQGTKQAILDAFYGSVFEDIKDQNSTEELHLSLEKAINKLTENYIKLELKNKSLVEVEKIEAHEREMARLEQERLERERIEKERQAELKRQKENKSVLDEVTKIEKEVNLLYTTKDDLGMIGNYQLNSVPLTDPITIKSKKKVAKKRIYKAYLICEYNLMKQHIAESLTADKILKAKEILLLNRKVDYLFDLDTKDIEKSLKDKVSFEEIYEIFKAVKIKK